MTEYEPPSDTKKGYIPNTQVVLIELHRLLAIFLSSKNFAELNTNADLYETEISILQSCELDEITRILLNIAITARVIDDRENQVFERLINCDCGTLYIDGKDIGLTLREACNKIIHAKKIHFDLDKAGNGENYLNPIIYLYGYHYKTEWKAELKIIEFTKLYVSCVCKCF